MKGFNWRWVVVPFTPTMTILHAHWLCYLMDAKWGTLEQHMFLVMLSLITTGLAAGWASEWRGW